MPTAIVSGQYKENRPIQCKQQTPNIYPKIKIAIIPLYIFLNQLIDISKKKSLFYVVQKKKYKNLKVSSYSPSDSQSERDWIKSILLWISFNCCGDNLRLAPTLFLPIFRSLRYWRLSLLRLRSSSQTPFSPFSEQIQKLIARHFPWVVIYNFPRSSLPNKKKIPHLLGECELPSNLAENESE